MSWNIGRIHGKPAAVAKVAAEAFQRCKEQAKHFPAAEIAAIEHAEQTVAHALSHCIAHGTKAVSVEAGGSASNSSCFQDGNHPGSMNVSVKVEPLHGFLE